MSQLQKLISDNQDDEGLGEGVECRVSCLAYSIDVLFHAVRLTLGCQIMATLVVRQG